MNTEYMVREKEWEQDCSMFVELKQIYRKVVKW